MKQSGTSLSSGSDASWPEFFIHWATFHQTRHGVVSVQYLIKLVMERLEADPPELLVNTLGVIMFSGCFTT